VMQCRDAQFYLRLRRQAGDELGAEVTADLDRHLAGCPACAADAGRAAAFDRAVANALRSVPVPAGLRDKLLAQSSTHHGAVIRRKVYRVAALAASLFFGVGLAFGVFSASRPKIDPTELVIRHDEQMQDREGRLLSQWLTAQKFPDRLPEAFDPSLIISMGTEKVQGTEVPVVTFAHPTERGFAKVYIFRTNGSYNTELLRDAQASHTAAIVIEDQRQFRGVKYVILHTGRDLTPFLLARGGGVAQAPV
jgi:hypothetical protein